MAHQPATGRAQYRQSSGWSVRMGFGGAEERALAICCGLHERLGTCPRGLQSATAFARLLGPPLRGQAAHAAVPCDVAGRNCVFLGIDEELVRIIAEFADGRDTFVLEVASHIIFFPSCCAIRHPVPEPCVYVHVRLSSQTPVAPCTAACLI